MSVDVYMTGMLTGLNLIVAIGAQNAFVLRQGLRREHVLAVCLTCAVSDAILILLGVTSFGLIAAWLPWLSPGMRISGAAFLVWYGIKSMRAALRSGDTLSIEGATAPNLPATLLACLAITWLNPHVYLDTVVLLGTISTRFAEERTSFAAGAVSGSFLFFFSLGYGAGWLRPIFVKPTSWRVLEAAIAVVMWTIAAKLMSFD
ncbi:LysE/ArgO family amino acid transporter [Paracoccus beibuensis]|uniref:LysE/ArgO family amino acid transporter n=1 Tax=Paracoccus beibuensis TaxID=547602 RepID=UPI00223F5FF2|nr:LysE/ArgO family amino acid transporter [Paracoccus beibuensis]